MKKLSLILMILLFAGFVSAATVTITPSAPTDKDNLVCDVAGSSGNYIYKWFKNGQFYLQSASAVQSHTLSSSFTSAGDKWTCKAYTPPIPIFGMIYKGEASVTIGQNSPEPTPPDNHSPYWRVIEGDKSVCAGDLVSFTLAASDPDGDRITYSVSPNIGSLCSWNGLYQWRTGCSDVGVHTLTFKASDGKNYVTQNVKITVNSCGRCGADVKPILNPINDKHVCPGDHVKITATAQYNGNDVLHYYVSRVPPGGYWNEATHTLNWFPTVNDIGKPQQISFWVEDQHCNSDSESVTIYVDSCGMQNHAPVLNPIENKQVCAGKTLSFYVSATDQDNDILTYSLTGKPNGAYWSSATRFFSWTPTLSDVGSHYLTFSVSDGKLSDSERIRIDVVDCTPKNHAPVIKDVPDKTVCEGEHLRFNVMATDADGDALTYSASNLPTGATFTGQTFDWTPKDGQDGIYYVTFRVSDGSLSDSTTAKITVKNCIVNHAPVLTPIGDKEICKGKTLSFMVSATDQDGDSLTYSAFGLPSGATFTNKRFTWTPQYTGTYYVTFSVSDGELSDSEIVKITVKNCNHCPVLESIPTQTICAESTLNLQLIASDLDGDSLTYSGTPLPFGSSLCSWNGVFSWTPTCSQLGTYDITFKVTDGQCDDSKTAKIIVKDCGACNHAPVIKDVLDKTVCEGEHLRFNVMATDADGDALTYSASNLPTGATFTGQTFDWTPKDGQDGIYYVTFRVSDGSLSDSTTAKITVKNCIVNHAPVLTPIGDKEICKGKTLSFMVSATDQDGDSLTYSAFGLPSDATFSNRMFTWTPQYTGTYYVTFSVSDGELSDSETVKITVKNCNHCPVLESIPTQTICAESTLNLQLIASDLDGDSLTYSGTPLPFGSSLCSWNGVFSWTPTCSQLGTYDITFKVTDGQCDDSKTAKIIVKDCGACNHAPVISIPDKTMNEGETLTINLDDYSSDIDGDDLTYTLISGVGAVSGKTYTYYANYQSSGDYTVTIQANDGRGGIAGTSFTIHVNNVPRKPTADFTFTPDAPKINEQVTFNASLSSDPDGNELTYSWDFNNDGITDATGVIVQHSFSEAKCYNVTLTVSNGYKQDSKTKQVCTTYKGKIEVKSIHCFDRVIINSKQSCSAELNIKTEAELKFYDYDTDSYIGSCYSDRLTGACTLNFDVHQLGTYKVYVKAYKNGYLPDEDKIPYDEYEVIKKRYEIEMLKVYNDTDYSNEDYDFFRGQTMYVRFMVKDLINNEYVDNVVTSASLVSPPGGRAELIKYKPNENHYYYYYLTIPPTHGFLGTSQVFAFAFNFSDNSGGEAYVDLTIRNNPPEILPIPDQSMETNSVLQLDLSSYKRDVEDSGDNLRWEVYGNNDFTASIDRDLLTIYSKNSIASTYFTLKLFDLDNNSDMVNVGLDIHPKKYPPIANPNGPYRFSPGEEIQFDSSGSRDPDGGSLSYEWSFGDGSISHEANPKHTYSQEGIYTVTLTVTDDEGEKTTAETHAYIEKKAEQQPRTTKDDLIIKNLVIGHKNIVSGSFIPVFFTVENSGPEDIKRAEITFLVRELGLKRVYRNVNIDSGKEVSKFFVFRNPGITGKFTMMVHIRQGDIERTKFVEFEIR